VSRGTAVKAFLETDRVVAVLPLGYFGGAMLRTGFACPKSQRIRPCPCTVRTHIRMPRRRIYGQCSRGPRRSREAVCKTTLDGAPRRSAVCQRPARRGAVDFDRWLSAPRPDHLAPSAAWCSFVTVIQAQRKLVARSLIRDSGWRALYLARVAYSHKECATEEGVAEVQRALRQCFANVFCDSRPALDAAPNSPAPSPMKGGHRHQPEGRRADFRSHHLPCSPPAP